MSTFTLQSHSDNLREHILHLGPLIVEGSSCSMSECPTSVSSPGSVQVLAMASRPLAFIHVWASSKSCWIVRPLVSLRPAVSTSVLH
eukprot:CAMPEP_0179481476 /NCGR_PEP_ID=MMETSP0799-20121207/59205_1 /TAXON_ID=46947 /ORGANISM="Geminigera cryophila, Strain CCMP2564" /LENGTH=86 /DNA_ID=CAMNT_0021294123 /DNA_START=42 /DNA_END=299 /DNA_ORIENTATION=-